MEAKIASIKWSLKSLTSKCLTINLSPTIFTTFGGLILVNNMHLSS